MFEPSDPTQLLRSQSRAIKLGFFISAGNRYIVMFGDIFIFFQQWYDCRVTSKDDCKTGECEGP